MPNYKLSLKMVNCKGPCWNHVTKTITHLCKTIKLYGNSCVQGQTTDLMGKNNDQILTKNKNNT